MTGDPPSVYEMFHVTVIVWPIAVGNVTVIAEVPGMEMGVLAVMFTAEP